MAVPIRCGRKAGPQSGQAHSVVGAGVVADHHLEQRVPGEGAGRVELLHDGLERHVRVGEGGEVGRADPGEELGETGVAAEVCAEHQGVHEEAHEVVEGLVAASGDGGAEGDVGARAEAVEEGGHGRVDHHEHAGAGVPCEPPEALVDGGVEGDVDLGAGERRAGGPGPVGGQVEFLGGVGQGRPPVLQLPGGEAVRVGGVAEEPPLPECVVGVLDGQRLPAGAAPPRRAV